MLIKLINIVLLSFFVSSCTHPKKRTATSSLYPIIRHGDLGPVRKVIITEDHQKTMYYYGNHLMLVDEEIDSNTLSIIIPSCDYSTSEEKLRAGEVLYNKYFDDRNDECRTSIIQMKSCINQKGKPYMQQVIKAVEKQSNIKFSENEVSNIVFYIENSKSTK